MLDGLAFYAGALKASRSGRKRRDTAEVAIESGYVPGVIGRAVKMHARYYGHAVGFGRYFESKIAAGLGKFTSGLDNPRNGIWTAIRFGIVVGTIAIDGEDIGPDTAHLRWYIVADGLRGGGIGRRLLAAAIGFCDRQGFAETQLWTFRGLDAAWNLYEAHGFALADEVPGRQWGAEVMEQRFVRKAGVAVPARPAN